MRALITHLDTPISTGGDTNVVYLHYASAKDLVPILQRRRGDADNEVPHGQAGGVKCRRPRTRPRCATIQAHEDNNALIISAPPAVFRSLLNVIRQLDVRRSQVLIEAVIAEVSDETANELGVQWQLPLGDGNHVFGGTNFSSGIRARPATTSSAPRSIRSASATASTSVISKAPCRSATSSFPARRVVTALRSDGKSNILSTPQVMTLDNQQAVIKVGQEVPFLTGSYQTTASSSVSVGNGGATAAASPIRSRRSSARTSA
jgi:general secretion pathway protein D